MYLAREGANCRSLSLSRFRVCALHPSRLLYEGHPRAVASPQERTMNTNTLLIILVVLLVLGGGGYYGHGRWF
jgi:hypothetical protein